MLEIIPNLDDKLLALYCKKCGKLHGPSYYLYLAIDRGETLAAGLFEVESDQVNVVYYESWGGPYLFDAVCGRASTMPPSGITKKPAEPFRSA